MRRLSKGQWSELLRLGQSKQQTSGKGRARTQNTLIKLGLARMTRDQENIFCIITNAGSDLIAARLKKAPPKRTSFKIIFNVEATVELAEDMLAGVLTNEWRSQFYRLMNSYDVAEHIAFNFVKNRAELKYLDGFADRSENDAVLVDESWEIVDNTILKPAKTPS
jgi:hypothetical protein